MMSDLRSMEHPTLKVPYESLNKRFRAAQKVIEREAANVTNTDKDGAKSNTIDHNTKITKGEMLQVL